MPFILAQKLFLRFAAAGDFLACLDETGGFKLEPCALAARLPAAFSPPDFDLCFAVSLILFRIFGICLVVFVYASHSSNTQHT
tara:strand:+ start:426 stop:674 length:249 start_codon:yes stop_codon:yes gene_type:complete